MADPAPMERHMPVGYRFHPTDQELVCHYLRHKLMADDPSIHETVPEICLCKYEPQDLPARAASAVSATKFDDFQCYFFSPRDYKHPKGKRLNRTTSGGFWKVTGEDGIIIDSNTNNVIGKKKHLVYHKGHGSLAQATSWIVHEYYYDDRLLSGQNTHVLCWLKKKYEKKIKEESRGGVTRKRKSTFMNVNQRNKYMNSNECYSSNWISTIQSPHHLNEATDSTIQPSHHLNEDTDSIIQPPNEVTDSMIQPPFQLNEATESVIQSTNEATEVTDSMFQSSNEATDSMIQPPSQLNKVTDSMIQPPNEATYSMIQPLTQLDEVTDSMIQPPLQSNEATGSMIQPLKDATDSMVQLSSQPNEVTYSVIQQTSQFDEELNSIIHTPLEPNFAVETFGGELHFGLFDQGEGELDLGSLWQ